MRKKIDKAQLLLSQLGNEYNRNANYLFLRGKVFYLNKLYYIALDTLLIALEFEQSDKIYNMLAEIYGEIGNQKLKNSAYQRTRLKDLMAPTRYSIWEVRGSGEQLVGHG